MKIFQNPFSNKKELRLEGKGILRKIGFLVAIALLISTKVSAQLIFTFEDRNISLWGIEGDGSLLLDTVNGHPGAALRLEEPAAGLSNFIFAHPDMLGDWSSTTESDSIFFDLFVHEIAGTVFDDYEFMVELRGQGSRANALPQFIPVFDQWQHVAISLDTSMWTLISGTWDELLANVTTVVIRGEFITGDEYEIYDNIGLTFSPQFKKQTGFVCSNFDTEDGLDGWNFQNVASAESNSNIGNPPNSIKLGDKGSVTSFAYAPPKFRGNLSVLDAEGEISFDLRVNTSLTAVTPPACLMRLAGPGGEAKVAITESDVLEFKNVWKSFTFPLTENLWTITHGNWIDLLSNVTVIELTLEFYNGTSETVYFDNFCMGDFGEDPTIVKAPEAENKPIVYPNPGKGIFTSHHPFSGNSQILVKDTNGRTVYKSQGVSNSIDLSSLLPGLYILEVATNMELSRQRIIISN
jgi:hypothetical protein